MPSSSVPYIIYKIQKGQISSTIQNVTPTIQHSQKIELQILVGHFALKNSSVPFLPISSPNIGIIFQIPKAQRFFILLRATNTSLTFKGCNQLTAVKERHNDNAEGGGGLILPPQGTQSTSLAHFLLLSKSSREFFLWWLPKQKKLSEQLLTSKWHFQEKQSNWTDHH